MKETRILWDMPITIEIVDPSVNRFVFDHMYSYFQHVDDIFNIYNPASEMSRINAKNVFEQSYSD